jgi:hypothetical protein
MDMCLVQHLREHLLKEGGTLVQGWKPSMNGVALRRHFVWQGHMQ